MAEAMPYGLTFSRGDGFALLRIARNDGSRPLDTRLAEPVPYVSVLRKASSHCDPLIILETFSEMLMSIAKSKIWIEIAHA